MSEINATMVKELRERTGVGMMECRKALVETNGNMDAAIKFLRERGATKAEGKSFPRDQRGRHPFIYPLQRQDRCHDRAQL